MPPSYHHVNQTWVSSLISPCEDLVEKFLTSWLFQTMKCTQSEPKSGQKANASAASRANAKSGTDLPDVGTNNAAESLKKLFIQPGTGATADSPTGEADSDKSEKETVSLVISLSHFVNYLFLNFVCNVVEARSFQSYAGQV